MCSRCKSARHRRLVDTKRLRKGADADIPVIMLNIGVIVPDRLIGLDKGADCNIVKPFDPLEVLAKVKAVLRSSAASTFKGQRLEFMGLTTDPRAG